MAPEDPKSLLRSGSEMSQGYPCKPCHHLMLVVVLTLAAVSQQPSPLASATPLDDPPAPAAEPGKPTARWTPALHRTPRKSREIRYIVIHTIEGTARGCISWFQNPTSKVSAHYVVDHDGGIVQMVRDQDVAWHAGVREYNDHGIGIEHEGYASKDLWTPEQMRASARLARWLCKRYGIPVDREHLRAHSEIAPGRKRDPGPHFDWDLYLRLIREPARSGGRRLGGNAGSPVPAQADRDRGTRLLKQAEADAQTGRYAEADRTLRRAARLLDGTDAADTARARRRELLSDPRIAAHISRARDLEEARSWLGLARGYLANGYPRKAEKLLERLKAIHPGLEAESAHALLERVRQAPPSELEEDLDEEN